MTNPQEAFQNRGGIEVAMGGRNQAIAAAHHKDPPTFHIENPERHREAMKARLLFIGEPSVRCDTFGEVFYETIVPGVSPEAQGKMFRRWNKRDSIFEVRDDVMDIIEAYGSDGIQYQRRTMAVKTVNRVDMRLQDGPLDEQQRSELRTATIQAMADAGYTSSVYPERVVTATKLVQATELDILGRPNNPRGRMIAESRRPQLIGDGLVADDILKKNRRRLSVIESVCDLIELDFENILHFSDDLTENRVGTGGFDAELDGYLRIVNSLLSPKNAVLPKPYSELGAKVRYLLYPTHSRVDAITLARYMDPLEAVSLVDEFPQGLRALVESDERKARIIAVTSLIGKELNRIRELRLAERVIEDHNATTENSHALVTIQGETPTEKRRRQRLEREWRWIDQGDTK